MELNRIGIIDMNKGAPITPAQRQELSRIAPHTEFLYASSPDQLTTLCDDVDALFLWQRFGQDFEAWCLRCRRLRWVQMFTSGVDRVLNSRLPELPGLRLSCVKGIHGAPISDHVLALIYYFLRQLPACLQAQAAHSWSCDALVPLCSEIQGKTVGIIGVGSIGEAVARKCKLLGMRVLGLKRSPVQSPWLDHCYASPQLEQLLTQSDFVVLCVPITPETHHLIAARQLKQMKPTAYLINVARGRVVDQSALLEALRQGTIAGAGLDVLADEPPDPADPIWDAPNTIITHHTAPHSPFYMSRAMEVIQENLRRYLADQPLRYEVELKSPAPSGT